MKILKFLRYVIDPRKLKLLLFVLELMCLFPLVGCRVQLAKDAARYEQQKAVIISEYEAKLDVLTARTADIPEDEYKAEIEALARLIQGTIPNHSDEAKQALCWLVFNRTEAAGYPDALIDVIEQPQQFDTYSPDLPITLEHYKLAKTELERYMDGLYRPVPPGYIYCIVGKDDITLRDDWNTEKAHEWRA